MQMQIAAYVQNACSLPEAAVVPIVFDKIVIARLQ